MALLAVNKVHTRFVVGKRGGNRPLGTTEQLREDNIKRKFK